MRIVFLMTFALAMTAPLAARAGDQAAVWPPPARVVPDGGDLHFRGGRGGELKIQFDGFSRGILGRYWSGGDTLRSLTVTRRENAWVWLEEQGQGEGSGICTDSSYYGVFAYRADAPDVLHRGARGTHAGTIDSAGVVHVRTTFENRAWPALETTWTPAVPRSHGADTTRWGRFPAASLREIPVDNMREMLVHPVWPPPAGQRDPKQLVPATPPAQVRPQ